MRLNVTTKHLWRKSSPGHFQLAEFRTEKSPNRVGGRDFSQFRKAGWRKLGSDFRHQTFFWLLFLSLISLFKCIIRTKQTKIWKHNSILFNRWFWFIIFLFVFLYMYTCVWCVWTKDVVRVSRCRELYTFRWLLLNYQNYLFVFLILNNHIIVFVLFFIFSIFDSFLFYTWFCALKKCVAKFDLIWV